MILGLCAGIPGKGLLDEFEGEGFVLPKAASGTCPSLALGKRLVQECLHGDEEWRWRRAALARPCRCSWGETGVDPVESKVVFFVW
jgi:hypothetical protein